MSEKRYDTVVVGAGPNGLSAGIELARRGLSVCVLEAKGTIGGGARTEELTAPGFLSDVCSAIHPVGVVSPFFRTLPLERWGVEWVYPEVALAHPFDDGDAALLSVARQTANWARTRWLKTDHPSSRAPTLLRETLRPVRIPHTPSQLRFALAGLLRARAPRQVKGRIRARSSRAAARTLVASG